MWRDVDNKLVNSYTFSDFKEAFAFMTKVAMIAERMDHHPNWSNSYNTVFIELYTHDKGNVITDKDRMLAKEIDKLSH